MEVLEFESVKLFEEIIKAGQIKNLISVSSHEYPIYKFKKSNKVTSVYEKFLAEHDMNCDRSVDDCWNDFDDYINQPMKFKKGQILEPENDMRFEDLKKFSTGILWDDEKSKDYLWVDSIQKKRNAIHSFTYKDIGTPLDFLLDVDYLCEFVDMILTHLPPVEDYIECYPAGYVLNVYFE